MPDSLKEFSDKSSLCLFRNIVIKADGERCRRSENVHRLDFATEASDIPDEIFVGNVGTFENVHHLGLFPDAFIEQSVQASNFSSWSTVRLFQWPELETTASQQQLQGFEFFDDWPGGKGDLEY
ncbi:hypothetical protein HOI18_04265 [Candidatus Uhrbacteria bacterium]|nr:hypothetical protein [Candidatus Uhrbacteria bacterium]